MQVDFTEAMIGIGKLMAAVTHDMKSADPSEIGMAGVSIRTWREAYAEGCKDMANKVAASLPADLQSQIKDAVMKTFNEEFALLEATTLPSHKGDRP